MELNEQILEILRKDPKVTKASYDEKKGDFLVETVKGSQTGWNGYHELDQKIQDEIKELLTENKKEVGGVGWLYNPDFHKNNEEYEKKNPRPVDPEYEKGRKFENGKCWRNQTYYWKTKGEGSRLKAEYRAAYKVWLEGYHKFIETENPSQFPGFSFNITWLGHGDDITRFYANTNYWGD